MTPGKTPKNASRVSVLACRRTWLRDPSISLFALARIRRSCVCCSPRSEGRRRAYQLAPIRMSLPMQAGAPQSGGTRAPYNDVSRTRFSAAAYREMSHEQNRHRPIRARGTRSRADLAPGCGLGARGGLRRREAGCPPRIVRPLLSGMDLALAPRERRSDNGDAARATARERCEHQAGDLAPFARPQARPRSPLSAE